MNVGDLVDAGFAEIKTGPFGTQLRASDYVSVGRPVLNVRNVGFGDVRPRDLEYVGEETAQRLSTHLLKVNDIVFGRKGAVERHAFIRDEFDGAMQGSDCIRLRVSDCSPMPARFITFVLRTKQHQSWMHSFCSHGATMASLNQDIVRQIPLPEIDASYQEFAVAVLQNIDDLIENNRRRAEVLEEMARAIYREWFVKFRYPGHEDVPLVDSTLGPIPEGWTVGTIQSVASGDRYSTTSGPFGSKLGRKDYQADGVPVIRGANLRVGGGFDETDFVFVSEVKAAELRSAMAVQGDILVTQRGTLGQVGRIPRGARFDRYVLSQSQMKLTVDEERAAPYFIYAQLCSERAIQRFIAQAMTAGVPHVNLRLLREFSIILPPRRLQYLYSDSALPLANLAVSLERENQRLAVIRDLLLPKLVSGRIDVSALDLDALVGDRVA
ncbi:restriction endonuclease subunit S [Mycobacterium sp. TY814]|uniref:restriction endonuclease subunit S n=1 Tax=unclassified Mycobacterium TaxID=2642494 RepID=UPI0027410615|nr:restriction endonuclease subunit S [Mycobacterium sp. TY814]MDP7723059.1 restriction endonuclease subunit S [Mycobacterium sp. TY814]